MKLYLAAPLFSMNERIGNRAFAQALQRELDCVVELPQGLQIPWQI